MNHVDLCILAFSSFLLIGALITFPLISKKKWPLPIVLSAYVFGLIFILRFMVIDSDFYPKQEESTELIITEALDSSAEYDEVSEFSNKNTSKLYEISGLPAVSDALLHSLQSFSLDEDYTEFFLLGREVLNESHPKLIGIYNLLAPILNFLAPILGMSIIIQFLVDIIPKLKIFLHPWRPKIVFSCLSPASIYIAEDLTASGRLNDLVSKTRENFELNKKNNGISGNINNQEVINRSSYKLKEILLYILQPILNKLNPKPLIIFTDTYPNQESEEISELFARAKAIKAIVLKTDISLLKLHRTRNLIYFLVRENYEKNVEAYLSLLVSSDHKYVWPRNSIKEQRDKVLRNTPASSASVFLFVDNQTSFNQIRKIQANNDKEKYLDVIPVQDYRNMAFRVCKDVPFFAPLLVRSPSSQEPANSHLTISIVGDGAIALEMFKTVFWSCQIPKYILTINCICNHPKKFYNKIQLQMPELLPTCQVKLGEKMINPNQELLKVFSNSSSDFNPPYGEIKFISGKEFKWLNDPSYGNVINETDYFIIATGSDESAVEITSSLDAILTKENMKSETPRSRFIVPVVFSPSLSYSISQKKPGEFMNYIIPTGTLESRLSYDALFLTDLEEIASLEKEDYENIRKVNSPKGDYNTWTNIAKPLHAPYKLFGMGVIEPCYLERILEKDNFSDKYNGISISQSLLNEKEFNDYLAWIEKRRWNAYMRSLGFCHPTTFQMNNLKRIVPKDDQTGETGNGTKNFVWKIHSCLCETLRDTPNYTTQMFEKNEVDRLDEFGWALFTANKDQKKCTVENYILSTDNYKIYDRFLPTKIWDGETKQFNYYGGDKALMKILGITIN